MAGPGSNELGSVSIGVQATGTDAAIQDLKRVEEQGKQTIAATSAAMNTAQGAPNAARGASGVGASTTAQAAAAASGFGNALNEADKPAGSLLDKVKGFTAPIQTAMMLVGRISGYVALLQLAWTGINYLQEKANESLKRHAEAEKNLHQLLEARKVLLGQVIEDETDKKRAALIESQRKEIEDTKERSGNAVWLELRLAELKKKHIEELAVFDARVAEVSSQAKRDANVASYKDLLKETESMETAARTAGMTEEQKIADELGQKRLEINRRIAATTDQYTIDLLNRQLQAAETVAQKQTQALQDKRAKERADMEERYREEQERIAETARQFSEAFTREARSASESIRDAFRDANTTNYLRDAAASLRAILQQRRL